MVARNRSKSVITTDGTFQSGSTTIVRPSLTRSLDTVADQVQPGNNAAFLVNHYSSPDHPCFTGDWLWGGALAKARSFPGGSGLSDSSGKPSPVFAGQPTQAQLVAQIVKDTNPSRPLVDVAVFAAELKDIPELLLKRTKDLSRDVSSGRLSMEFGWKPIASDLKKLLNFSAELDARVKELEALDRSGIRRKRDLWSNATAGSVADRSTSNREGWVCRQTTQWAATRNVWGFVKWVPTYSHSLPPVFDPSTRNRALQAILGLTVDAYTIWELLPFSWLADWCSNWGDLLASSRNTVGAVPSDISIMEHTVIHQSEALVSGGPISPLPKLTSGKTTFVRTWETKKRTPGVLTLEAHMPFLSERQALILADVVNSVFRGKRITY